MLKFRQYGLHPINLTVTLPLIGLLLFLYTENKDFFIISTGILFGFISILIHELGHVFAGSIPGAKLNFMSAGPILLIPNKQGKLKVTLNSDLSMMLGMESSYVPIKDITNENKILKKKLIPEFLGGPLANIVAIILCSLVRLLPINNQLLIDTTSYFIIINIAVFIATIFPLGEYTDGAKIVKLIRNQNIETFKLFNDYLNPNYKLTEKSAKNIEHQLEECPQLSNCLNIGIMLIRYQLQHHNYEHGLYVINKLIDKHTKEDGQIMQNLLHFHRALLLWASKSEIDEDTLIRLNNINYTYGRTFLNLAEAMLMYSKEDTNSTKYHKLVNDSKKWIYKIMDPCQEEIVAICVQSMQKQLCA